ncbi:hypothetical protein BJ170DRAFT_319084 [Xylariales sp. AK1849]|nr:hypothetical protein BJ170DRAFT_319084 [Xylariales sp. AK1849]
MTLTMPRLPPDSFLPSGALLEPNDHHLSFVGLISGPTSHPNSVISPLALPRNTSQLSYFDDHQLASLPPPRYRHPSAASGVSQPQTQRRYLSPHRSPPTTRDQRSTSLSPTRRQNQQNLNWIVGSGVTSPSLTPTDPSIATSPEQTNLQLRRVTIQNRRLLENWEAERAHLEANRARAEEIYKEERAIMDEERLLWAQKEDQYVCRMSALEQENIALREFIQRQSGVDSPDLSTRSARDSAVGGLRGNSSESVDKVSNPAKIDLTAVRFRSGTDSMSPGSTPVPGLGQTMPVSRPFVPLDPRMQSGSPQTSSPGEGPTSQEIIPSIDVQEVHPGLEGIPLKATAVKKSTFTDGKPSSPLLPASKQPSPTGSNQDSPTSRYRTSPAELTKEALQAPEEFRLKLHAGHTPNHSLSNFKPTPIPTDTSNTADSSGAATPTREPLGQREPNVSQADTKGKVIAQPGVQPESFNHDGQPEEPGTEALLEPSDNDRELSGPLSLRNRPAHDEIFLEKVDGKLIDSLKIDNATPTVLKSGNIEPEVGPAQSQPAAFAPAVGTDDGDESSKNDEAGEIPLRFKNNSNFGAPLGTIGRS